MTRWLLVTVCAYLVIGIWPAWAAIPSGTAWEVRPTNGSDTNGGGFTAAGTGTDYSVNNNKNASGCTNCGSSTVNLSVTDGVTNGTTTITSSTANFSSAIVGNVIYVTGGTGSIAADWYEVATFTNSTTIVVDRSTGLTTGTGVTLNIGGAILNPTTIAGKTTSSNKVFMKAESTMTTTATISFTGATTPANGVASSILQCYTSSRTDGGQCTIQAITNTGINVVSVNNGWTVRGLIADCNNLGTCKGIVSTGNYATVENSKVMNFTTIGIDFGAGLYPVVYSTEVTGGASGCTAAISGTGGGVGVYNSYIHANACHGISAATSQMTMVFGCVINSNSGSSTDGINSIYPLAAINNTIDNNGRSGIRFNSNNGQIGAFVRNNMLTNNGQTSGTGYGFEFNGSSNRADPRWDGNCYYNNKTGNRHFADDTSSQAINGTAPYTNTLDVALSSDPYVSEGTGNLALNNTASAGAACRGTGTPGSLPGYTGTGSMDFGALQSAPPVAAPTGFVQ